MLKKTITYTNYNNEEITEDFYFNLNKAELMEMELTTEGGLGQRIESIVKTKDVKQIVKTFKEIILKSYGEKSPDGKFFVKSEEISQRFSQTEAYNILFMEIATDADKASDFIKAIIPAIEENKAISASK